METAPDAISRIGDTAKDPEFLYETRFVKGIFTIENSFYTYT